VVSPDLEEVSEAWAIVIVEKDGLLVGVTIEPFILTLEIYIIEGLTGIL